MRRGRVERATVAGSGWDQQRELSAEVLYELLTLPEKQERPRAAVLVGLRITGRLNFEAAHLQAPLIAHNCYFDEAINLIAAQATQILLTACRIPGVAAERLETRGDVDLTNSTIDVISLLGAHIKGQLNLSGVILRGASYPLDLGDGTLRPRESPTEPVERVALIADGLRVDASMFCRDGFQASGELRLLGAHVAGQLLFDGAAVDGSLNADGLQVGGSMFCRDGFRAAAEIRLPGAHIHGQLDLDGAQLRGGLRADGLQIDHDLVCENGFRATAKIHLPGAHVAGQLSFDGAALDAGLNADGLRVGGDLFCRDQFHASGELRLRGAHIAGQLDLNGATLVGSLCARGAQVDSEMRLQFASRPAAVDLNGARAGALYDSEAAWPARLDIRGFAYGAVQALEDTPPTAQAITTERRPLRPSGRARESDLQRRLRWIALAETQLDQPGPRGRSRRRLVAARQPYTQLIGFYRREGRDSDARRVAYERERRQAAQLGLPGKAWNAFLRWTVGYGYKPLRALVVLLVLIIAGSPAFSCFHDAGDLMAAKSEHPPFVAVIYTIDRLIPVVSFGLRDGFAPSGAAQWWAFAYTLLGWMLSIAIISGVTAAVRRD